MRNRNILRKLIILLYLLLPITLFANDEGFYLFSPLGNTNVYLIDNSGEVVHQWKTEFRPGNSVYLLENGNLLRAESIRSQEFDAGGSGGRLAMYDPISNKIWSFYYSDKNKMSHHDIEILPNGNILIIAWEKFTKKEAFSKGLNPDFFDDEEIWADHIIEVNPKNNSIVWEWHVWDHLVQDYDVEKPGKINLNYFGSKEKKDWNHINSIDYSEEHDQILLSVHSFSEIWIIDHSINTTEAKGEKGDLLYRWGNPEAIETFEERHLYSRHHLI